MSMSERFPGLANGMKATLYRVNRGRTAKKPNGSRVTVGQLRDSHEAEVERLEKLLEVAREKIARLEAKIALLEHDAGADIGSDRRGELYRDRRIVTQAEAAEILHVAPYTISRWVQAGHFEMTHVPGRKRPMIYADSLHKPARKSRRKGGA